MRLDLFDLQLLLNIAETGSFSKAAEHAALSVQACSERIKKLEQRFCPLLIRHSSGVQLTPAGQIFVQHARLLLKQYAALQQDISPYLQHQTQHLTLWCNSSAQSEYLPKLLPQYLLQYEHLNIHLKEAESTVIIQNLQQGIAKLGLISDVFDTTGLQTKTFIHDPLVLICPMQHPLCQYASLSLTQTLNYPWIGLMPHHALQQSIDKQLSLLSATIEYRLRLLDFQAIAQVVSTGLGIAIMPAQIAQRLESQYAFRQIALHGKWANRTLQLACQDFMQLPPAHQALSDFLLTQTKDLFL
ncbi:MAG: LysR family transcriptional regulator [Acinetobacter populi]|jgi:DNA-binding transcriptional LysR family regulator|uniref:LysR family transcriptional regulator n=1 Tax=Acinetobacter populi TaxID=1582270 RepID=UPI0023533292|nr:LysR family transcriptional regulator [Acinetobacter populi]MCH4248724.1 LysR family transcriptional regulator [Acinetobacter populi]